MYANSMGVQQDFAEALRWYRLAAEQGYALAQANLGVMYWKGMGVKQEYVQACMWLSLAAAQGNKGASDALESLSSTMTPSQIAEAKRLAREWKPKR